jgi:sugar phosphate permease
LNLNDTNTYGYTPEEYSRFKEFAWKVLLSFGLTYMFFYNGRQNINLVMTQMAEGLGSTTAAMGVVSSALFWCYAFGQLINGRLGAYFGYKNFMDYNLNISTKQANRTTWCLALILPIAIAVTGAIVVVKRKRR